MDLTALVLAARQGDTEAQGALYERTWQKLYYFALKMLKNPDDALDAVQDSYIAAFSAIGNLEKPEAFSGWLYQITANRCKKLLRKRSREGDTPTTGDEDETDYFETVADPDEALIPGELLERADKRQILLGIIDALPEAQRACVMLYYFSGLSVAEIAGALECSEGTVKSRLNYARQKLRQGVLAVEERDDIRLHALVPLGLLLGQGAAEATALLSPTALWSAVSAGTAAAGAGAAAGGAGAAKAGFLATVKAKVIAGVTAAAMVVGGGAALVHYAAGPKPVAFQSAAFEQNVRALLEKPEGGLYPEDLEAIRSLLVTDEGFGAYGTDSREITPLEGAAGLDSLADLRLLPDVHALALGAVSKALLDTVPACPSVSSLRFVGRNSAEDLGVLAQLPNLREATLSINAPLSLEPVKQCASLRRLHLMADPGAEPLSLELDLSGLTELTELSVAFDNGDWSTEKNQLRLTSGTELPALRMVTILADHFEGMEALGRMTGLEALNLYSANLQDVSALAGLERLRAVFYVTAYSEEAMDWSALAECPSLEVLLCMNAPAVGVPAGVTLDDTERFNAIWNELQQSIDQAEPDVPE